MDKPPLTKRRRWPRISLRFLLGLIAVAAVPLAWIGQELHYVRAEQSAISELERQNHGVVWEPSQHWLRGKVPGFDAMTAASVAATGSQVDDATLELIGRLRTVRTVRITSRKVTDDGIAHLARLRRLNHLFLRAENVTDAGVAHLARLSELETLNLQVATSDQGLADLSRLTKLRQLVVVSRSMDVTDRGLAQLEKLSQLTVVSLVAPGASAEGFGRLAHALPNCKVRNDSWQSYGR